MRQPFTTPEGYRAYLDRTMEHRLQVTSAGGVGTTLIGNHFITCGLPMPTLDTPDSTYAKHQPEPPHDSRVPEGFRALYLFGDPRISLLSMLRRKNPGPDGVLYSTAQYELMRPMERPATGELAGALGSLEKFIPYALKHGDPYKVHEQMRAWYDAKRDYPIVFAKYDALPRKWPGVMKALSLKGVTEPEWKPRRTTLDGLDPALLEPLTEVYADALRFQESLPEVELRGSGRSPAIAFQSNARGPVTPLEFRWEYLS